MLTIAYFSLLTALSIGGAEIAIGVQEKNEKNLLNDYDYYGIVFGIGVALHALRLLFLPGIPS
ncbi:MAG: hypothetical protein WA705_19855 [Candidatus Ozemobacteraceae bacterium]